MKYSMLQVKNKGWSTSSHIWVLAPTYENKRWIIQAAVSVVAQIEFANTFIIHLSTTFELVFLIHKTSWNFEHMFWVLECDNTQLLPPKLEISVKYLSPITVFYLKLLNEHICESFTNRLKHGNMVNFEEIENNQPVSHFVVKSLIAIWMIAYSFWICI